MTKDGAWLMPPKPLPKPRRRPETPTWRTLGRWMDNMKADEIKARRIER